MTTLKEVIKFASIGVLPSSEAKQSAIAEARQSGRVDIAELLEKLPTQPSIELIEKLKAAL